MKKMHKNFIINFLTPLMSMLTKINKIKKENNKFFIKII